MQGGDVMTHRERMLLDFIISYHRDHDGVSPSFTEMRDALGLHSKSGIHRMLSSLEEQNYIRRQRHRKRRIEVVESGPLAMVSDHDLAREAARRGWVFLTKVYADIRD